MKRDLFFVIVLLFTQGFTAVPGGWGAVPVSTVEPKVFENALVTTLTPAPASSPLPTITPFAPTSAPTLSPTSLPEEAVIAPVLPSIPDESKIERVLIVSFDGMRPDAIAAAGMTNLMRLMKSSAYTLSARTISYPTTLPSHTSMLSGMCMEKHGLSMNSRSLYRGYARGTDIFDLMHDADQKSVMIVGKDKLDQIPTPDTVGMVQVYWNEALIAEAAAKIIPSDFDLMFLHFPTGDIRGHKYGWMSKAQFKALREGDDALEVVLAALDENNMLDSTLVIVTADHGGHDRTHDGTRIEDFLIPWIASGPGIVPGELKNAVKTMDTAATVAYALGLPIPPEWDGIPVYEAFGIPSQDVHYRDSSCE